MTSDQLAVSSNTITLPQAQTDIGILLPDGGLENWDADLRKRGDSRTPSRQRRSTSSTPGGGREHTARISDITLPQSQWDSYDDHDSFDLLSSGAGIASGEFDPDGSLDLGLDLFGDGDAPAAPPKPSRRDSQGRLLDADGNVVGSEDRDDLSSIGVGRDAGSEVGGRQPSILGGRDDITMDLGGDDGFDFGLDAGGGIGDDTMMSLGGPAADRSLQLEDMTPRTKEKVEEAARKQAADAAAKAAKARKQMQDRVTELVDDRSSTSKRTLNDLLLQGDFLPNSERQANLLAVQKDPGFQLAGSVLSSKERFGRVLGASELNLCSELNNFFVIDLEANRAAKRARYEEQVRQRGRVSSAMPDDSMEVGRRAADEGVDFMHDNFGPGDDTTFGLGDDTRGGGFDMDMGDIPDMMIGDDGVDASILRKSDRVRAQQEAAATAQSGGEGEVDVLDEQGNLAPLSRFATPALGSEEGGSSAVDSFTPSTTRLLAAFEHRPSDVKTQEDDELAASMAAEDVSASQAASKTGWTKNTIRAQRVIRSQLKKSGEADKAELSFGSIGENASRRAAAGFFFELLVLGSRDKVRLRQEEAYGDISIGAKSSLWDDDV